MFTDLGYRHTAAMRKRLDLILLSFGVGLFLCAIVGMLLLHHTGSAAPLWLLVPSFFSIAIGADRKVWHKAEAELIADSIWFAPNS